MKIRAALFLSITFFTFSLGFPLYRADAEGAIEQSLLITEVKLNDSVEPVQFVELYNRSTQAVNLAGWAIEYAKYSFPADKCGEPGWKALFPTNDTASRFELSGTVDAKSSVLFVPPSGKVNKTTGGSFRLLSPTINGVSIEHDLVGWGFSSSPAACKENAQVSLTSGEKFFQRKLDCADSEPLDTNYNSADFVPAANASPGSQAGPVTDDCQEPPDDDGNEGGNENPPPAVNSDCEGAVISEVLPNPGGADVGQEFIELHNSTNSVLNLANCKLQTSSKSTSFTFPSLNLQPGEHKAFYDSDTLLNLTNSSGGSVWLLDHQNVELDEVNYPADMEDDVSYALFESGWKPTYTLTPNEENILQAIKPCPAGQFRNLETNRCNKSVIASALTPCKPGKVRNPETKRCRSIASLASVLKPCDADQFRNPLTNRCKKLASANVLKPCHPGQERNPETNRCRKVSADLGTELNEVKDVPAEAVGNKASWWFAGASIIGAVGYAGFEWRKEFFAALASLKSKIGISSSNN